MFHAEKSNEPEQDFSKPWEQSDLILLVEGQQLHVHRLILAISSPVFSRMFAANFKEKNAEEVPLPGKKCDEIREMLLAIYPTSWKAVDKNNCYFLLDLAREYQIIKLTEKCENYLLEALTKERGPDVMETLMVAQDFVLDRLLSDCINRTQSLSLGELKRNPMFEQIEPLSQRKMIELQVQKAEEEITRLRLLANEGLQQWDLIVTALERHIQQANSDPRSSTTRAYVQFFQFGSLELFETIKNDQTVVKRRQGICQPLNKIAGPLEALRNKLKEITSSKTPKKR